MFGLLIEEFSTDPCHEDLCLEDFARGDGEQVLIKNDDVGELSGFERAFDAFFKSAVGRVEGVATQGLHTRHSLGGIPASCGGLVVVLASDGRIESPERSDGFDGGIGAADDSGSLAEEGLPDISALFGALWADASVDPGHIRGTMGGLHGGDDAKFGKAWDVGGVEDLRVFDTEAWVFGLGMGAKTSLVCVQDDSVGSVADGVNPELKSSLKCLVHDLLEGIGFPHEQATIFGVVIVRFEECGATGAKSAVRQQFEGTDGEVMVSQPDLWALCEVLVSQFCVASVEHEVHAKGEFVFAEKFLVQLERRTSDTSVMKGGKPCRQAFSHGDMESAFFLVGGGRGDMFSDEAHRGIDENAGGMAILVAEDFAAGRVGSVFGDPCELYGFLVGPTRMTIDSAQKDGVVRGCLAQDVVCGEALFFPVVLVPAAAQNPLASVRLRDLLADHGCDLSGALSSDEVQLAAG